jgi:hypothetical protein
MFGHDLFVETAQGSFTAADTASAASAKPCWEVHEVFAEQPPRRTGAIDVDEQGHPLYGSPAAAEDRRILLEIVWADLA